MGPSDRDALVDIKERCEAIAQATGTIDLTRVRTQMERALALMLAMVDRDPGSDT